jgi:hypothetical protein
VVDFTIGFKSVTQVNYTAPTCAVNVAFNIGGPHEDIDSVQVYAIPAGPAYPSPGLGNVVDDVDLYMNQFEYATTVQLPAGTSMTIGLCPRSETEGVLDDQIDGQYWETFCIFRQLTTTLNAGPGNPQVTVTSIQPFTLNNPNQITIAWSGSDYTNGNIYWGPLNNQLENEWSWTVTDQGNEPQYSGSNLFPIPSSLQGKILAFKVELVNNYQNTSSQTIIGVQSARNYHSVRDFLQASNVQFPTGVNHPPSMRAMMQI